MPEGNEVHRWAERHNTAFAGRKLNVLPGPGHRFSDAHLVDGKKLKRLDKFSQFAVAGASILAMSSATT